MTVVMTVVLVLVAAACRSKSDNSSAPGGPTGSPATITGGTYTIQNCEPSHLVPQNDYESCGAQVLEGLWTRLVTFDPTTGVPLEAQAESISVSDDGLTWTIKIKPGWTFHNGEPVTAQSYVDAWNYAAYGPNGYILNFFFDKIQGYDALNPNRGEPTSKELSGLKVIDDTTFTVTLDAPFSQFESQLGFDAFDPLPKVFYDDPKAFDEQPIGDGPYMMDGKWKHDESIDLKKYENYAGTPGYADKIKLLIYQGDAAWLDFQAGNLDIIGVYSDHLGEARKSYSDTLQEEPGSLLLYLAFPMYEKSFQNPLVRQALSMAVDRQAVINAVFVAEQPADDFAPPTVAGYRHGICQYCVYDPEAAKAKLAEAGGWTGELTLNFPGDDPVMEQGMEAVANQWKQNLGIDVKLNPVNPNSYYDFTLNHEAKGPWWDGWVQDYPSLQDYLEPLYGKNGGSNNTGYDNPQFDALLAQGNASTGKDGGMAFYQRADDLLLNDMPAMPWGYLGFNWVNSPNVTNVTKVPSWDMWALEKVQVVNQPGSDTGTEPGPSESPS
jgi:peptide/nickel transport system substrate-binding protein/oligopeptide transport system substrate-binding protein